MGKKIKKAVKKVVKQVTQNTKNAVKDVGKVAETVGKTVAGVAAGALGQNNNEPVVVEQAAPAAQQIQAPTPAQSVEVAKQEQVEGEDEATSESGRRKARAGGKKSLSVARSSGGGINI